MPQNPISISILIHSSLMVKDSLQASVKYFCNIQLPIYFSLRSIAPYILYPDAVLICFSSNLRLICPRDIPCKYQSKIFLTTSACFLLTTCHPQFSDNILLSHFNFSYPFHLSHPIHKYS